MGQGGRGLCYLRNYGAMRTKINVRFTPYGTQVYLIIQSKQYSSKNSGHAMLDVIGNSF